jgi:hypothetical protein
MSRKFDENGIADQIVGVLPAGFARELSSERDTIRYAVRGGGMKLRTIIFNRASLRRLANDPAGVVKVEYLQRDLLAAATQRTEFRYPRPQMHIAARKAFTFALPMALAHS